MWFHVSMYYITLLHYIIILHCSTLQYIALHRLSVYYIHMQKLAASRHPHPKSPPSTGC